MRSDPACETGNAPEEVSLESRLRSADPPSSVDRRESSEGGHQRSRLVAQSVLVDLREFDRGHDGGPPGPGGQGGPGIGRVRMTSYPPEHVRAVDRDPLDRPRFIDGSGPRDFCC